MKSISEYKQVHFVLTGKKGNSGQPVNKTGYASALYAKRHYTRETIIQVGT